MSIVVSGLTMRFRFNERGSETRLAGPAIYAAIGCALSGNRPKLLAVISTDVSVAELGQLQQVGVNVELLEKRDRPSLVLSTALLGERSPQKISDNPLLWMPLKAFVPESKDIFLAANGDPDWLYRTLTNARPAFIGIDLHHAWSTTRVTAMNGCVTIADFVSGTEEEFKTLRAETIDLLEHQDKIVMRKNGALGVTISRGKEVIQLPPPPAVEVTCNVGAGDLLFGAMAPAAVLSVQLGHLPLYAFRDAYLNATDLVSQLLSSRDPDELFCRFRQMRTWQPQ